MTAEEVVEMHRKIKVFHDVVAGKQPYSALMAELADTGNGSQINWLRMAVQDQILAAMRGKGMPFHVNHL